LGVDVESAVADRGVLTLVEEVVELQFEVNEFQFQLRLGITKPCVTIGSCEIVVVVLGRKGDGEFLRRIDAHGESLRVAANSC